MEAKKPDRGREEEEAEFCPLPVEILLEILSYLPVKTLTRFKCVSNQWRYSISTPEFAKLHLNNRRQRRLRAAVFESREPPSSIALRSIDPETQTDDMVIELSNDFKYSYPDAKIWNSCDGLVLFNISDKTLFVWNPSTRDHARVRHTPVPILDHSQSRRHLLMGIGYDKIADDYKVVGAVQYVELRNDSLMFCYSLKQRKLIWVRTDFPFKISEDTPGVAVDGVLHWIVRRYIFNYPRVIIYYDFAAQVFVEMTHPSFDFDSGISKCGLAVLRGSLCVVCHGEYYVEVLGLETGGGIETWARLFLVPYGGGSLGFSTSMPLDCKEMMPLCFTENGEVILAIDRKRLVVYNLQNRMYRLLFRHPEVVEVWGKTPLVNPNGFEVAAYVESLVSPHAASKSKGGGTIANVSSTGEQKLRLG